jgi:HSP20 family molecular chaperone IbpA
MTTTCEKPVVQTAESPAKIERPVYEPAADVIEKADAIHVLLDLPGVDQKGLDVTVEEHVLIIRGKTAVAEQKPGSIVHREFEHADYERTFRLGNDVDESRIAANLKNGLLRITIPKSEAAKPRQISVKAE